MTFTFFNSDKVKIFPCARRGSFTDSEQKEKIYDAESRLTTESNLTRLSGLAFNKDSYIIDTTPIAGVKNGQLWRLVIKGYYFEVETTLPRIDYFVIGLEETNSIPRTRLGVLARDDQKGLGHDSAATKVDIVNVNTLESECRAICAISLDGEAGLNLDSSFCYWVSTTDTLDSLNAKYLNSSLDDKFSNLEDADTQILTDAKDYAAGLAGNYEAAGSVDALRDYAEGEFAKMEGRLATIEGSDEGSITKTVTEAVSTAIKTAETTATTKSNTAEANAKAYADQIGATAKAYSDEELSKAVRVISTRDNTQDEEISKKLDKSVYETYINGKTMSDAELKRYADDAINKCELALTTKVDTNAQTIQGNHNAALSKIAEVTALVTAETEEREAINTRLISVESFFKVADDEQLDTALDTLKEIQGYLNGEGSSTGKLIERVSKVEDNINALQQADGATANRLSEVEAGIATITTGDNNTLAAAKKYADEKVQSTGLAVKDEANQYTNTECAKLTQANIETEAKISTIQAVIEGYNTKGAIAVAVEDVRSEVDTTKSLANTAKATADNTARELQNLSGDITRLSNSLNDGTAVLTNLNTRVTSIEENYIKQTDVANGLSIYAVAFDLSKCGDISTLAEAFIAKTAAPIVFISGCTTLPEASGYIWQDAAGNQITEDSIDKNLILYLTKV